MRSIRRKLLAVLVTAAVIGQPGGLPRCAAQEADTGRAGLQVSGQTHSNVFSVLGLSFLCAGGVAVLTVVAGGKHGDGS